MARIIVSTVGTIGDLLPFIGLGRALRARGHDVVLAVNPAVHALVRNAGLSVVPCGPAFGPDEARRPATDPAATGQTFAEQKKWEALIRDVPGRHDDLLRACTGADLLVAHSFHYAALLVHDQLRLPWACVSLLPGQFLHRPGLPTAQPAPRADLNLLACHLLSQPANPDTMAHVITTGFWFHDGLEQPDWAPTAQVRDFLGRGERPLVLCLGSLPGPGAGAVVSTVMRAVARIGKRLVVQTGWADRDRGDFPVATSSEHVLFVPFLAHEWLFPHAAAVIHHGGIGVTARALRHGCPMLVLPWRKDQFFHASLIRDLGVGGGMHPAKLSVDGVSRMLTEKICDPPTLHRARAIGKEIRSDDGLAAACGQIESFLDRRAAGSPV